MGHLIFAGLFLFLIILLIGKISFSYIYAAKRGTNTDEEISVKMGEKEKLFHVKRSIKLFGWVCLFLNMLILIYLFKVLRQQPEASNGLWMAIDFSILGFFVFIILLIKGTLSYIRIKRGSFEYRDLFRVRAYSKEEIENVYQTKEFIFVKREGCKMPIIIETIYDSNDCLYKMLCNLQNK